MGSQIFNIGDFYNKRYFKDVDFSFVLALKSKIQEAAETSISGNNQRLLNATLPCVIKNGCNELEGYKTFNLKVAYPGLITGIGLNHEASIEGEFKLGVHFDSTTGIPVVYGSSVKGVLRCYFEEYCKQLYPDAGIKWDNLQNAIFEGLAYDTQTELSIYKRDVFFDAVIVHANKNGKILSADSITPHDKNPLKNPALITFMKIAPGCEMEFRFLLRDTSVGDKVVFSAKQKADLFAYILKEVGVGAKTNVGYGQFL